VISLFIRPPDPPPPTHKKEFLYIFGRRWEKKEDRELMKKKPKPAKTKNPFKKQKLFWGNGQADLRGMWGEQRPD
jgi:hypothetical protein